MRIVLLVLLMLVLAGCGASPAGTTGTTVPATDATAPVATTSATDAATPDATAPATGSNAFPAGSVESKAVETLLQGLSLDAGSLELTGKELVEWSDGSLGCPVPGMTYTQAIVPGYRLTFSDGTNSYDVHTDEDGSRALVCRAGKPVDLDAQ